METLIIVLAQTMLINPTYSHVKIIHSSFAIIDLIGVKY